MGLFRRRYHIIVLVLLVIAALSLRLYFAFQTPYFNDDSSYFELRQIEEIRATGTPLYDDPLSYGGRTYFFPPLFNYIMALFSIFMPSVIAGKVMMNLFAVSLIIIIYLISQEITRERKAALIAASISAFIPIFFQKTVNSITPYALVVPLFSLAMFFFIKMHKDKRYGYHFIFVMIALVLAHPIALILPLALLLYLILLKLDDMKETKAEIEVVLFSLMLASWFLLLIYKSSIQAEGFSIIWQNIPSQIILHFFHNITALEVIAKIGIIPFLYGLVTIYRYLFKKKTRFTYLFISIALLVGLLIGMNAVIIDVGLVFLGMILTILYSIHFKQFRKFVHKTKFARLSIFFTISLTTTIVLTQIIPSYYYASQAMMAAPIDEEIAMYNWLALNTDSESAVLTNYDDGHKIAYFAGRRNVVDSNFLGAGDTGDILDDIREIYKSNYKTTAIELLDRYDIDYIIFSEDNSVRFGTDAIRYIDDECFEHVYSSDGYDIYRSLCRLEEQGR